VTDEDRVVIICAVAAGNPNPAEGSVTTHCADCGVQVWLAPTGQGIVMEHGASPLCIGCGTKSIEESDDAETQPIWDAQRIEVLRALRRSRLDPR